MGFFDKFKKKIEPKKAEKKVEKKAKAVAKKPEKKKEIKEQKPKEVVKAKAKPQSLAYRIIKKPLISEKASVLSEVGKYVFIVNGKSKKQEVRRAINDVYGVKPTKINFINIQGKTRRYGKTFGRTSDYKKAVVTLPEGKAIQVHEGV